MADSQPTPCQAIDFLTLIQNLKVSINVELQALLLMKSCLYWWSVQKTKRTGWVRKGVLGPESIADHMYRMGLMALICNDSTIDSNRCTIATASRPQSEAAHKHVWLHCRCIKLAIVHDVAEGEHTMSCMHMMVFHLLTNSSLSAIVGDIAPSDNVAKEVKNQLETEAMHKIRNMLGYGSAAGMHQHSKHTQLQKTKSMPVWVGRSSLQSRCQYWDGPVKLYLTDHNL